MSPDPFNSLPLSVYRGPQFVNSFYDHLVCFIATPGLAVELNFCGVLQTIPNNLG